MRAETATAGEAIATVPALARTPAYDSAVARYARAAGSPTPPGSVTSILGHDLWSGTVRLLGLAFLLLHVGQLLYLVGLCALAWSVAACCLSIFELGLGSRGGCLLGRRNRGLFFALGGFGRILSLGSHVVGLLLCGGGRLLGSLRRGVLGLFGSGPRSLLDLTLFGCARVFLVPDRVVALGLQFVVGLLVLLGRCRVELGRPVQRITVFDESSADLVAIRSRRPPQEDTAAVTAKC